MIIYKGYLTLDITILNNSFSAERDYECQILLCQISIAFRHKNNFEVLPKGVLIDLNAHDNLFMCTLRACLSPCTQVVEPCYHRYIFFFQAYLYCYQIVE